MCGSRLLTQQVLHALSRLDDLGADRGAADAIQDVVSFSDDLNLKPQNSVLEQEATFWSQAGNCMLLPIFVNLYHLKNKQKYFLM